MPCQCVKFPFTVDAVIPIECERRTTIDMAGIRKVRPALKKLHELYLAELQNETYDPADPKWHARS
jgi:hypothetical protein